MKILIKVTKEILEKSSRCIQETGFNCAIALAVREIFPNSWTRSAFIHILDMNQLNDTKIKEPKKSFGNLIDEFTLFMIQLPEEAQIFIDEFDSNGIKERLEMEPISFEIDVPDELINEIGISQVFKILSESKTLEHVN